MSATASRILADAARLQWAKRAEETRMGLRINPDKPYSDRAKDKWAVSRLIRAGELDSDLADAAMKYAKLQEDSHQYIQSPFAERVSEGRGDPHAGMLARARAIRRLAHANREIAANCRPDHVEVFLRAFAFPHRSMARLRLETGKDHRGVARALRATLTILWMLWGTGKQ